MLERFRFALKDTGILFLGKAEMLLAQRNLFVPVDLKHRFFRKVPANQVTEAPTAITPTVRAFDVGEFDKLREEASFLSPFAQFTVTAEGTIAATNLRADSLFGIGPRTVGRPLADLEASYRPIELRRHLDEAMSEGHPVTVPDVAWTRGANGPRWWDILVTPIVSGGRPIGATVTFDDSTRFHRLQEEYEEANRQLEAAYEELQSTNEELETTNEELQSTVEELETTNEELQSTNEELETMNEELQSMNDELQSINEELRERTMELDHLNRFMDSVLASLRAAVVVVGKEMEVQAWNRRAEDFWGLRQDEVVGQHFLNLDIGLPVHQLAPVIRKVLSGESLAAEDHGVVLSAVNRRGRQVSIRVNYGPLASADGPVGVIMAMDELEAS
jgi:two-component system, chemotaxis family, CheB/CheR fusion protein